MGAPEQQPGMTAAVLGRRCNLVFPEEIQQPVPCRVRPLRILEDELAAMVDWEEVRIECTWNYVPVPEGATVPPPQPLVVAHTLAGGALCWEEVGGTSELAMPHSAVGILPFIHGQHDGQTVHAMAKESACIIPQAAPHAVRWSEQCNHVYSAHPVQPC